MRLPRLALLLLAAAACAPAVVVVPTPVLPPLEAWAQNHPAASQALGQWVHSHPPAASWLFEWDGRHPLMARDLVEWALVHPGGSVPAFAAEHPGWPEIDAFATAHVVAVHNFFEWCVHFPAAARALVAHPGGLRWAGHHLYGAELHLSNPG